MAYNGGLDGFDVTREVLIITKHLLKPSGILWLETFLDFPARVREFVQSQPELEQGFVAEFDNHIYM